jgi:hypothetical protein
MTAPIANPSWPLKIERIRRKIRALESGKGAPDAEEGVIRAAIAALEVEIEVLRTAYARELVGDVDAMKEATKGGMYGRYLGGPK